MGDRKTGDVNSFLSIHMSKKWVILKTPIYKGVSHFERKQNELYFKDLSLKPSFLFLLVRSAEKALSHHISVLSNEKKFGLFHNVSG